MPYERWHRVEALFAAALEHPPAERAAFLGAACHGDAELSAEVARLLAADEGSGGFLDEAIRAGAEAFERQMDADQSGRRIGRYRLLYELGRGGIGSVYLAARDDDHFEQQVAIKLIRRGMDSDDILRRFRTERQILASLAHPNIAELYDGGTTEEGVPYFVMEYIEGLPIDRYCDAHRLGIEDRLRLVRTVCSAVHYAHRNLVVHRDLKPSNVLVTAEGVPKLLDFGIAKLLDPRDPAGAVDATLLPLRPMTPGYASPEQMRGEPLTTATDVYSLGLLIYELLTGRRPYSVDRVSAAEAERLICEAPPPRASAMVGRAGPPPSGLAGDAGTGETADPREIARQVARRRRLTPEQLRRRLRGDLDNILRMALDKEPARRYGSVECLAADLERHLAGRPVQARRPTAPYRFAKFVRRHRLAVAAAAATLLLALSFAVAMALQSRRTARERDRATRVSELLVELFEMADPGESPGALTAQELLDRGAERVVRELDDQPRTQAMLMDTLGGLYRKLGLYREATPLLEEALAIRRRVLDEDHPEITDSLNQLGTVLAIRGDFERAEPLFREALARRRAFEPDQPHRLSSALNNLALLLHDLGDYAAADPLYRGAIDLERRHPRAGQGSGVTTANLALLLFDRGDYEGSEALYREALDLQLADQGPNHPDVAETLKRIGRTLQARGRFAEAESLIRRALELQRQVLGDHHIDVVRCHNHLGALLAERGDLAAAEPLLVGALTELESRLGADHSEVADALQNLAALRDRQGDAAEAARLYARSVAVYRAALPTGHPLTAAAVAGLGRLHAAGGDCDRATPLLEEAIAVLRPAMIGPDRALGETLRALGRCYAARGATAEAAELVTKGERMIAARRGDGDGDGDGPAG